MMMMMHFLQFKFSLQICRQAGKRRNFFFCHSE
jgi:hypothetical protein